MLKDLDDLARLPDGLSTTPLLQRPGPYLNVFCGRSKKQRRPVLEKMLPAGARPKDKKKDNFSDAYLPTGVWRALVDRAKKEAEILTDLGYHYTARQSTEALPDQFSGDLYEYMFMTNYAPTWETVLKAPVL